MRTKTKAKAKAKRVVDPIMSARMKESWARRKANGNGHTATFTGSADTVAELIAPSERSTLVAEMVAFQDIHAILNRLPVASRLAVRDALTTGHTPS